MSPQELHSLISNIPLVLFILAITISILSLFIKKKSFNLILLILISVGTLFSYFSMITAESAAKAMKSEPQDIIGLFTSHQSLAKAALYIAIASLILSLIQTLFSFFQSGKIYRIAAFATLLLLIIVTFINFQLVRKAYQLIHIEENSMHSVPKKPPAPYIEAENHEK
ncbi:MAG: hypothetical protein K9M07_07000 [Simkaniaceae bacterium]|nr:hypothetical protein [Simkaniaceae bacterium]MCF7852970.1 hypothetical protein [Simkaniaceae bacterium]